MGCGEEEGEVTYLEYVEGLATLGHGAAVIGPLWVGDGFSGHWS